jgi:transposase
MLLIGIDWADDHHDFAVVEESGQTRSTFQIKHTPEGINSLRDRLRSLSVEVGGKENIAIGIETHRLLLVDILLNDGYTIYPLNPKAVDRYRDRYTASQAKSDTFDAVVIANAIRTDRHRFAVLKPDSELLRELRILVKDQRRLIRMKTMCLNQLQACLKEYYPVAIEFFDEFDSPTALEYLKHVPTPVPTSERKIEKILRTSRHPHPEAKAKEISSRLSGPQIPVEDFVVRTKSRLMLTMVEQLKSLRSQIKEYQDEIDKVFDQHPDAPTFRSLPGAGSGNAPRLLTEIGDNRTRYSNADRLQCEGGTCPVTRASGTRSKNNAIITIRRACRKSFRDTMHQFSFSSLQRCSWARALYDEQKSKGKTHGSALRSVGDKWLKIIYRLWQDRTLYDEKIYLAQRMKHQLLNQGLMAA